MWGLRFKIVKVMLQLSGVPLRVLSRRVSLTVLLRVAFGVPLKVPLRFFWGVLEGCKRIP